MISARTVFLVGGQGSQYFGMGKSLLANEQYASTWCSLNDYVKAARGIDVHAYVHAQGATIADACDNLPCTSAALLMLQLALADTLRSRGVVPDVLVGSSLGEFGAMVIAGYVSPFQVLDFVIDLAEIVQHGVPRGGMLAVLGSPRLVLGYGSIEVVARNHANHTIIAGTDSDLAWAEQVLNGDDVLTLRLPTPAPFHSSLLDPVRPNVLSASRGLRFEAASSKVWSAATATRVDSAGPENIWHVLRAPMRLVEAVQAVPAAQRCVYVDLSPGGSLAGLLRGAADTPPVLPVVTPFHNEPDRLTQVLGSVRDVFSSVSYAQSPRGVHP